MATITYDDRSFLLDGKRIWLVSGSIHYFRVPPELWRDRLLKAQRAGLNCVCTCAAWNFHEPEEGNWQFEDGHDIAAFVRTAGELGLYVILRPGPFIRADWDFGGLPGWLSAKTGVSYRTNNAAYTHYFDKYFSQVLQRLSDLQVTRGGNIILIQNENEYFRTTMPERLSYLEFISQLFRRSGFDIPIITCNRLTDPPVPDTVECVNGLGREVQQLKKLRIRQPGAPMLVTEFHTGAADCWGGEHRTLSARDVARRALEVLGCGAQYNYYMWHGGTNFAFWAPRLAASHAAYQTTSYDYDAPLAEGGGLTEKYYLTRLPNLTARHMGPYFADTVMDLPGVTIHDSTDVLNLSGPRGRWAIVSNHGRDDVRQVRVCLAGGAELSVPLEPFGAAAIPAEMELAPETTLDYANLTPLGLFAGGILVFHGPAEWEARISINGHELRQPVPADSEPKVFEHQNLKIVLVNSDLAMRTWVVEDSLVFGPDFVGQTVEDLTGPRGAGHYAIVSADGTLSRKRYKGQPAPPRPIKLGKWKRVAVCPEPTAADLKWRRIERPRDVDRLGMHQGYVWYRLEMEQPRARRHQLFLPDCEDRAMVFVNRTHVGTWGRGSGAVRTPISAEFRKGRNVITLLVDNLGRFCDEYEPHLGGRKGLFGHVYDARPLRIRKFKVKPCEEFTRRMVPRPLSHLLPELEAGCVHEAEVSIPLGSVTPVHVSFTDLPHHVCVLCNGRVARFFPRGPTGANFGDLTLGPELKKGANSLKLLLWGDVQPKALDNLTFHLLVENLSDSASWSVREWTLPEPGAPAAGRDRPAWFTSRFRCPDTDRPLFLRIAGARKGQILLNGHNLGRFWTIGPQEHYYLPSCWLQEANELMLFEERGLAPTGSKLAFQPEGPYRP